MRTRITRGALRYVRTGRYLADLLVWSRVFVVRRTTANIRISRELRADRGVAFAQPQLEVDGTQHGECLAHGFDIIYDVLFANLRKPTHLVPVRHALPAPAFAGVYLWDSAFIAQVWRHWDRQVALDILRSVVAVRDGDRLQHVVADFVKSPYTQPPLIAWSAVRLFEEEPPPRAELEPLYQALCAYHQWLNRHRRLPSGLYFWLHPYESGVENAPRFSSTDEKQLADTTRLAAPDLSAYMVMQCEALAWMANQLAKPEQAEAFNKTADAIRQQMNDTLWHEDDGLYYDVDAHTGAAVRSRTIASLLPLAAGVCQPAQVERLLEHLRDPRGFGSPIPLPSVALNDASFEKDMWRGPVWINTAYLVLEGLHRYGRWREYGELAWRLCDGVFKVLQAESQVYEFYDPESFHTRHLKRKRGNLWKAFTLGTGPQKDFVGWSGLVNTLVIEGLIGYRRRGHRLALRPCLPEAAAGLSFRLRLPQDDCEIELTVLLPQRYAGEVRAHGHTWSFDLLLGQSFEVEISQWHQVDRAT